MFTIAFKLYLIFIRKDDDVTLKEYEVTCAGLIQSNIDRYQAFDEDLQALWKAERHFHNY